MRPPVGPWHVVGLAAVALAAACAPPASQPALTVFAASSLAAPLEELAVLHELRSGQPVRVHLGASGTLARQVREGAPCDLLLSADDRVLDQLAADGVVDARSTTAIAANRLALVVDGASEGRRPTLDEILADPARRIGVGDPDVVPVGRYAREWLEGIGRWEGLVSGHRLVLAPSAQAVLAQVRAGAVDAAIVFRSDARATRGLHLVFEVPASATTPIHYVGGVVTASRHRQAATVFLDVLAGRDGQRVLEDAGFVAVAAVAR